MRYTKTLLAITALIAGLVFAGCDGGGGASDSGLPDTGLPDGGQPDGGPSDTGTTDGALTIEECIKSIGWQYDFVIETDLNGFEDGKGTPCTDASTSEWYMEDKASANFQQIIAWDSLGSGTCSERTPAPLVDAVLCTISGTHTWEKIPGVDPSTRMIMVENVTTVSGDFSGDGTDDQCGPSSALVGTSTRFIVILNGECESGAKAFMWQPVDSDTEPFPGNQYTDTNGLATPLVLCKKPGTVGSEDHIDGRKICPTSIEVEDQD